MRRMTVSLEKSAAGPTRLSLGRVSYYASSKIHIAWPFQAVVQTLAV